MLQANYLMGRATLALVIGRVVSLIALYGIIQYVEIPVGKENFYGIMLVFSTLIIGSIFTFFISFYFVAKNHSQLAHRSRVYVEHFQGWTPLWYYQCHQ